MVYADSLNAVSAAGFRFTGGTRTPAGRRAFRKSIEGRRKLPCDIIISVHPLGASSRRWTPNVAGAEKVSVTRPEQNEVGPTPKGDGGEDDSKAIRVGPKESKIRGLCQDQGLARVAIRFSSHESEELRPHS